MNTQSGLYEIRNIKNGKIYIGSAINFHRRFEYHKYELNNHKHSNGHLQNAWDKYGKDSFNFYPLLICSKEMLLYYEQVLLDNIRPQYNIATSARAPGTGIKHTEESIQKFRLKRIGHPVSSETRMKLRLALLGKPGHTYKHTEEAKKKMSIAKSGIPRKGHSEETKQKIREALMGNKNSLGCTHPPRIFSEETRQKLSLALMGNKRTVGYKHTDETRIKMSIGQKRRRGTLEVA